MFGLLGKKVGMTQVLNPIGGFWPVTAIEIQPAVVTKILKEETDGYNAIQVGFFSVKEKHLNKAQTKDFQSKKIDLKKKLKEYRLSAEDLANYEVGQEITVEAFQEGDFVDIHGSSIGKGFQGVIRRHNMARGPETHGSMSHRRIGSIGMAATPSKTLKGHRMPGHMGNRKRTVQNLLVVKVDKESNYILVKGGVVGHKNAILSVTKAIKRTPINIEEVYAPKQKAASKKK